MLLALSRLCWCCTRARGGVIRTKPAHHALFDTKTDCMW